MSLNEAVESVQPARTPRTPRTPPTPPTPLVARRVIGKIACTKNFHCVHARNAATFYKVLAQLN